MAQTSDELKTEIERTRDEMGDTVGALAYKADVPSRTKEWLGEKKDAVVSTVSGASDKLSGRTPDGQDVKRSAGVGEASRAYLNSAGSSHDEFQGITSCSDATTANDWYVYGTSYLVHHI